MTNRRKFIKDAALVSLGFSFLSRCSNNSATPKEFSTKNTGLKKDPRQYLDLPEGFQYKLISKAGSPMVDGFLVPGRPDGMGAFDGGDGKVILIRNHENSPKPFRGGPFGNDNENLSKIDPLKLYDAGNMKVPGLGGTTTVVYNENTGEIEKEFLSLAGTYRNCAGGVTPWNSWLTCEEDTTIKNGDIEKDHGYVFEIPAVLDATLAEPKPILGMGRFNHEAVAVDPQTGIVYQTEDQGDGLIYRYIPNEKGNLHAGGKLQALAIRGQKSLDTRNWKESKIKVNEKLEVEWLDLEDVTDPAGTLRKRGFEQGAAKFARGEGMWYGNGEIYFACTNGGPNQYGQVFRYKPSPSEGTEQEKGQAGALELFAESPDKSVLHMCDNLVVAPWGDILLCEDNGERNYIRGINQSGEIYTFACNRSSRSEFAGAVFSPSGKTLFINIQENGDTLAISGPWEDFAKNS